MTEPTDPFTPPAADEPQSLLGAETQCPRCHAWQPDYDGFGVLRCESCGYCSHASIDGDTCGLCNQRISPDGKVLTKPAADETAARYDFSSCDYPKMDAEGKEMLRQLVNAAGDRFTESPPDETAREGALAPCPFCYRMADAPTCGKLCGCDCHRTDPRMDRRRAQPAEPRRGEAGECSCVGVCICGTPMGAEIDQLRAENERLTELLKQSRDFMRQLPMKDGRTVGQWQDDALAADEVKP